MALKEVDEIWCDSIPKAPIASYRLCGRNRGDSVEIGNVHCREIEVLIKEVCKVYGECSGSEGRSLPVLW